jgi:hypothetical protein
MAPVSERSTFYEGPDDIHLVGRNASLSWPVSLLERSINSSRVKLAISFGESFFAAPGANPGALPESDLRLERVL